MTDNPGKLPPSAQPQTEPRRRRVRYAGKYPRRFEEKYKEHNPTRFPETHQKVIDSGKTPAGTHRPIMLEEVLTILSPQAGQVAVDCTLGHGGHAEALLGKLLPGGKLVGLDQDPYELPKTEVRLRSAGFGPDVFVAQRTSFAGLSQALNALNIPAVDLVIADLGVSSMQLDDPRRGFSVKYDGPLDMRMNPNKGQPAASLLQKLAPEQLSQILEENADEPSAVLLGRELAGKSFGTTAELARRIRQVLPRGDPGEIDQSIRRTFQALRIAVNDELAALDSLLRQLPFILKPGGRVAILSFHSGEDRRVKKAFAAGFREGVYAEISPEVIRPTADERNANPRSAPAKLRWAKAALTV